MFYTKSKLPGGRTVKTEITDESVFTKCPECGREIPVDLAEILFDGEGDLFSTHIICSRCTAKRSDAVTAPLTYDGLVWLEHVLSHSGYEDEIPALLDAFSADALEDLNPDEYSDFGNALAKMVIGARRDDCSFGGKERRDG